jgi:hypothetical protein
MLVVVIIVGVEKGRFYTDTIWKITSTTGKALYQYK